MDQKVQVFFGEQTRQETYRTDGLGTVVFKIVAVDGERVRRDKDIDFTMAGHRGAFPFIPSGEIWVDDVYEKTGNDLNAIILHEMVEAFVMERFGLEYEVAHEIASAAEGATREVMSGGKKP